MGYRTVLIRSRSKLDYSMGYLVIRNNKETYRVFLDEISVLIIESTAVSLTAVLLNELCKIKAKVIFCDEKHNPCSELISYYGSHDTSGKYRQQLTWSKDIKEEAWTEIVKAKILNQQRFLQDLGRKDSSVLKSYYDEVEPYDKTNREAHAAKVYFSSLFGRNFSRSSENPINAALNYGYSILLSIVNREINAMGYMTQLGLFHDNMFNHFNLSSDLMEPFRILVDMKIYEMEPVKLEGDEKFEILRLFNDIVNFDNKEMIAVNAIRNYCHSIVEAINDKDLSEIKFWEYEL